MAESAEQAADVTEWRKCASLLQDVSKTMQRASIQELQKSVEGKAAMAETVARLTDVSTKMTKVLKPEKPELEDTASLMVAWSQLLDTDYDHLAEDMIGKLREAIDTVFTAILSDLAGDQPEYLTIAEFQTITNSMQSMAKALALTA